MPGMAGSTTRDTMSKQYMFKTNYHHCNPGEEKR